LHIKGCIIIKVIVRPGIFASRKVSFPIDHWQRQQPISRSQAVLDKEYFVLAIKALGMNISHHAMPLVLSYDVLYVMDIFAKQFC
jgi:hypothetical protein